MKLKKVILNLLITSICLLFTTSCSNKKEKNVSIYRNFYEQDITTFNYIVTNEHSNYTHIANFVDGLVENDKYGNIVPSIAKSWESKILEDKQIWTFYLKEDVYWSDYKGKKYDLVTANDFVTTLKYILNYNIESNHANLPISLIDGALNYYNATLIENYNYDDIIKKIDSLKESNSSSLLSPYIKIKDAFEYCNNNNCSLDFNTVGIKAINDFQLEFTLSSPTSYFLSVLTYCPFLPTNENFIKEIGFNNFGTNKKYLLYNGAYILKDYFHSSKIEYTKNHNYWDEKRVYIDKIILSKLINYPTSSYTRLAYETGNVDGFYVNPSDSIGWEKYVTGKNNLGTSLSPIGINTYSINDVSDFTTYLLLFNQNRTNNKYSTLSSEEIKISNIALSNVNFRKALIYGIKNSAYSTSFINQLVSSIIPASFVTNNNKDYHSYYLEKYAKEFNISYEEALLKEQENTLIFNANKSEDYLSLALEELSFNSSQLPIKIEFSYFYSQEYAKYNLSMIKEWNNILNGCKIDDTTCNYNKILIVNNSALSSYNDFTYAVKNGEYGISLMGLYPNFIDPTAYLDAFAYNGELYLFLNHNLGEEISFDLNTIKKYYKNDELDMRYELCANLEYKIIFEYALVLPLFVKNSTNKVLVTNLIPYQRMKANYGLSPFKFKLRKLKEKDYTQQDILQLQIEYEKGRHDK